MLYAKYDHNEQYADKYAKSPIFIYLFCHDDLDEGYRSIIYRDYLRAFMFELEQLLRRNIIIELHYALPGFTDMSYTSAVGQERTTLDEVEEHARAFIGENDLSYRATFRYGLITRDGFSSLTKGLGLDGGSFFMASLTGYQCIAHEIGHTFRATHEDAEVSFGIPPSQTYMHERNNPFYVKDYRFSDANRKRMADFLASEE
jgi:hypothetical protein